MRVPFHVLAIFLLLSDPFAVVNANSEGKPTPFNIYTFHVYPATHFEESCHNNIFCFFELENEQVMLCSRSEEL